MPVILLGAILAATPPGELGEVQSQKIHHWMHAQGSYRPNDTGRRTVCLVHGMNSSSGSFVHMVPLLERAGFGVVLYDYDFDRDLDRTCPDFVRDWQRFRRRHGERAPWVVVTHSMGAMLARWYVESADFAGDVTELVMIGPPNGGSALARNQAVLQVVERLEAARAGAKGALGQLGKVGSAAAADLLPGSRFLTELNARPRAAGVSYRILAGSEGFLTQTQRSQVAGRFQLVAGGSRLLGGLARAAVGDLEAQLDELTDGTGDGCVSVASTRLEGVAKPVVIPANHVALIRGPLLYPEPGPVACMPHVLEWLGAAGP